MTYTPASLFRRTDAERNDESLSWARDDRQFFAAGACHILAWTFLEEHPNSDFLPVGIRYLPSPWINHVYVSNGVHAFDFFGWTSEQELLTSSAATAEPEGMERVTIDELDLEAFCQLHNSRLLADFYGDVKARARAYLARFPVQSVITAEGVHNSKNSTRRCVISDMAYFSERAHNNP